MSDDLDDYLDWSSRTLSPNQLTVYDISSIQRHALREERLELNEVPLSFLNFAELRDWSKASAQVHQLHLDSIRGLKFSSKIEEKKLLASYTEYGWLSKARLHQEDKGTHCRWIHISGKFSENLKGVFVGLSDWSASALEKVSVIRDIERHVQEQERFSKHGKQFAPFFAPLGPEANSGTGPLLISVPFLDWSVHPDQETPPLRFNINKHDRYNYAKSATHPLRSLLQYYYRLEDTSEREKKQVFAKHRPWYTDRDIDLKVRRWYGQYPASIVVDELWVLVIDETHVVSFSANQSWKSRWPPLQLASRIAELSFRRMRDAFSSENDTIRYNSILHTVACLHGAVGLMHRSFWTDQPLPCTERYGGYLSHLQYRIYRSPSTRLVMDLLQTQDELNICNRITQQQLDLIAGFKEYIEQHLQNIQSPIQVISAHTKKQPNDDPIPATLPKISLITTITPSEHLTHHHSPNALQRFPPENQTTSPTSPQSQFQSQLLTHALRAILIVSTNLQREQDDLSELRTSCNELVTRTIQLVNIRMEDHGQAILVFTVVTVIFLPLSFMASFFGMNTLDIRALNYGQWLFWACGMTLTAVVVLLSVVLAFYGGRINEALSEWRAGNVSYSMSGLGSKLGLNGGGGRQQVRRQAV